MNKKKLIIFSNMAGYQAFNFKNVNVEYYQFKIRENRFIYFIKIFCVILITLIKNLKFNVQYLFIGNAISRIGFPLSLIVRKKFFIYLEIPQNFFYFFDKLIFNNENYKYYTSL